MCTCFKRGGERQGERSFGEVTVTQELNTEEGCWFSTESDSDLFGPPAGSLCSLSSSGSAATPAARSLVHTMATLTRSAVKGAVCAILLSHGAAFTLSPVPTLPSSSRVAPQHVPSRPSSTRSTTSRFLPDRRMDCPAGGSRVPGFVLGRCPLTCIVLCASIRFGIGSALLSAPPGT